ncbi:winged helix-turn-helix domain-containing protein [Streptomyces sp. NPDC014872]|uniref:helix-turn-helix domain-containing protein n=1 Tax=Streptomyces sp. NPDC014872 TaxID=3364926 RepID=UPI0036FFBE0F
MAAVDASVRSLAGRTSAGRWPRVKTVIGLRFHLTYTIRGLRKLLVRSGWSCQVPARRAMERDDEAVAGWGKEVWPARKARGGPWSLARLRGPSRILHVAAADGGLRSGGRQPRG